MGFNKNGNLVAEIFMSLGKIIAGVLSILLFENNYSRALDKSKPTTIHFFLADISYERILAERNYNFGKTNIVMWIV